MKQRGLVMPVLLRLDNLLEAQISLLNETFNRAIQTLGYKGEYHGVFPIKVNQQCPVIEEIARVHGYAAVPSSVPVAPVAALPVVEQHATAMTLRHQLAARGGGPRCAPSSSPPASATVRRAPLHPSGD